MVQHLGAAVRTYLHTPAATMRALLLLALLVTAGCDSTRETATSELVVTDQATLSLGDSAVVDGIAVTFVSVVTDSRCPDTSMCVWAGWGIVALDLDGTRHEVHVVDPEQQPTAGVRIGDRFVFATALTPKALEAEAPVDPTLTVATAEAR